MFTLSGNSRLRRILILEVSQRLFVGGIFPLWFRRVVQFEYTLVPIQICNPNRYCLIDIFITKQNVA